VTEHIRAIPDLTDLHWCDGGTPETATEPDESLKEAGYVENAHPAQVHWNWREREIGRWAAWAAGNTIRRFPTLSEGIAATAVGDEFRVHRDDADVTLEKRGDTVTTVTTVDTVAGWCCDGQRVYVGYNAAAGGVFDYVRAYSAVTGAQLWTYTIEVSDDYQIAALCCDGTSLFVAATVVESKLYQINASTGALIDSEAFTSTAVEPAGLACNGVYVCAIGRDTPASTTWFFSYSFAGGITEEGEVDHGALASSEYLHALCMGPSWVAVTGVSADTVDDKFLRVYSLTTRAEIASINGVTTYTPDAVGWALAWDGDHLYLGTNHTDPTGASYESSFWVYGLAYDPAPSVELIQVWREPPVNGLSSFDVTSQISTDGTYVAFADSTGILRVYRAGSWTQVYAATPSVRRVKPSSCDGWLIWYQDAGDDIKGMMIHPEGRRYVRGLANNFARFPVNYGLAQPR
jgi:hypothetical protein